jgi:hypothetical protein
MYITCVIGELAIASNCQCCAERRMLALLRELSRRRGNAPAQFTAWVHRKFGELVITRTRRDGQPGTSLPCVMCRKVLDRLHIPWRAHIDRIWVSSTDENVPPSKPTQKQKMLLR